MSIKTDSVVYDPLNGPFTVSIGGSGGTSLSDINKGSVVIGGGDVIQGKMISVDKTYSVEEAERLGLDTFPHLYGDKIKIELIELLMAKLIQNKCVEFTKQEDFVTNSIKFRARIFVTPDDMVRLLRKSNKG